MERCEPPRRGGRGGRRGRSLTRVASAILKTFPYYCRLNFIPVVRASPLPRGWRLFGFCRARGVDVLRRGNTGEAIGAGVSLPSAFVFPLTAFGRKFGALCRELKQVHRSTARYLFAAFFRHRTRSMDPWIHAHTPLAHGNLTTILEL